MESNTNQSSPVMKIVIGIVAVLLCCACMIILAAGFIIYRAAKQAPVNTLPPPNQPTIDLSTPIPVPTLSQNPSGPVSTDTLDTLNNTLVPENDPYKLACRLQGICDVPKTVPGKAYQAGDKEIFWVSNNDTAEHRQINATLLYVTPHTYFWAEDGTEVNQGDMKRLMNTFENEIYPTDREFFGSEWIPGIDDDPHIFVIYAGGLGRGVAGYFSTSNSYNPLVSEYSNAHETYMLSSTQDLANDFTYGVLAHEFVHMIQFASDLNDSTWITEGMADVGMFLNGYSVGNHDWAYTLDPDLQLNTWDSDNSSPHYGQSFLYLTYFLDRFGEEATKALNANPKNGLSSVDDTLTQLGITDPLTGKSITAEDLFMDWAATLYLMNNNVGDGRFTYHNYTNAPQTQATESIPSCPQSTLNRSVSQYGIDYISITCSGEHTLTFQGSTSEGPPPTEVHSGKYAYWSNKGDVSDMTLTREFDLTDVSAPVELSFWTWYDIEEDWDYVFLEASIDGENWEILKTPSGTDYDPSGNSYGWGYTGATRNWIQESIDLARFAGQKVYIRFEYVTDESTNGEGFLLDDVRVDAINYQSDFESGDNGWEAVGFARVENVLPQTYRLSLITKGDTTTVTNIELNAEQSVEIPLSLQHGNEAILIVTGTTRYTTIPALYQIEVK